MIRAYLNAVLAVVAISMVGLTFSLMAHEGEMGSVPQNGATVQGTPEQIGIYFDGVMRITQFDVTGPEGRVRLEDGPGSEPTEDYRVAPAEKLSPGTYQVQWRGLARDAHMMSGNFSFTVEE